MLLHWALVCILSRFFCNKVSGFIRSHLYLDFQRLCFALHLLLLPFNSQGQVPLIWFVDHLHLFNRKSSSHTPILREEILIFPKNDLPCNSYFDSDSLLWIKSLPWNRESILLAFIPLQLKLLLNLKTDQVILALNLTLVLSISPRSLGWTCLIWSCDSQAILVILLAWAFLMSCLAVWASSDYRVNTRTAALLFVVNYCLLSRQGNRTIVAACVFNRMRIIAKLLRG